jgi:hypothetical protein
VVPVPQSSETGASECGARHPWVAQAVASESGRAVASPGVGVRVGGSLDGHWSPGGQWPRWAAASGD